MGWQSTAAALCLNVCRRWGKMSQPKCIRTVTSPRCVRRGRQRGDQSGFPSSLPVLGGSGEGVSRRCSPALLLLLGLPPSPDLHRPTGSSFSEGHGSAVQHCCKHPLCLGLTAPCHQQLPGIAPKPQNSVRIIPLPFCGSRKTFILTMKAIIDSTH